MRKLAPPPPCLPHSVTHTLPHTLAQVMAAVRESHGSVDTPTSSEGSEASAKPALPPKPVSFKLQTSSEGRTMSTDSEATEDTGSGLSSPRKKMR